MSEPANFEAGNSELPSEGRSNERSSIAFPYTDLDTAVEVSRALYARAGRGACSFDELAAEMNQTVSGAFRLKTSAARTFNLIDKDGRDSARLTPLGLRSIAAETERAARVEAFLSVPLYNSLYENYRGSLLPPAKALEREMATLGVAIKVTDRARQAFERSARQAGFFESGENRLVKPKVEVPTSQAENSEQQLSPSGQAPTSAATTQSANELGANHPFVQGLLQTMPKVGENWPIKDRAKWLKIAANAFDLIYEGQGGEIIITTKAADEESAA